MSCYSARQTLRVLIATEHTSNLEIKNKLIIFRRDVENQFRKFVFKFLCIATK